MSSADTSVSIVDLEQINGFQFRAGFGDGIPEWHIDEPEPIGTNTGPTPEQLLASAAGYCLTASLNFALGKFREDTGVIKTRAEATTGRNEEGRKRITGIHVTITLGRPEAAFSQLERALAQFENFCVVAGSIRKGIPVRVTVADSDGKILKDD
ncbi:OsmC family protein [Oxalobacter vibrioformis]|uniref:OsmC family protein n=1 Tax=Oxalobacter vibrioformis TaxID=933080 RepID=A0A9E9LZ11_9BURK|nr:OsmC family protein [Oxalobacter vibrioformis]WAW10177.1 OsmC family protein [Oxalobacter vibrioformis]